MIVIIFVTIFATVKPSILNPVLQQQMYWQAVVHVKFELGRLRQAIENLAHHELSLLIINNMIEGTTPR